MDQVILHHRGESKTVNESEWQAALDEMVARLGPWVPGESSVERVAAGNGNGTSALNNGTSCLNQEAKPVNSTWTDLVTDDAAKVRIEGQHDALRQAGVNLDKRQLRYDTGTRMADGGYATQHGRAREHAEKMPLRDAIALLTATVEAEERRDTTVNAIDLGQGLSVNGKVSFDGLVLREQAIRGLLARLGSPALSYVLGLRDRIADTAQAPEHKAADKASMLDVLQRECRRFGDTPVTLRTRRGVETPDVFAVVSPGYSVADAPSVLPFVQEALPADAKASIAYHPDSTAWEVRASVFTPTPVDEQAVGEPFSGFVSFQSRDNGTRRLTGGGGILVLACLNASVYTAESTSVSRVHRGDIHYDLARMAVDAGRAITALCAAWGVAKSDVLTVPALVPMEEAVPGFFRYMLTARHGELVGVLPGRREDHVAALARTFDGERRNPSEISRADLGHAWTRYVQGQSAPVRRDAEQAIGRWLVSRERIEHVTA